MPLQTVHRGIRKMAIALWEGVDDYGPMYEVRGARNMSVELVVETDELMGDDVRLDRYSKIVAATANIEIATVDLTLLQMIHGGTLDTSETDYEDLTFDEDVDPPYVGIAGRIAGSGGNGDLHIFLKKARLSSNLALAAQTRTYMTPTATFEAVSDGTSIYTLRNFTGPTGLAIPLRTTLGFEPEV
jgi:hypothetical protein